MRPVAAGPPLHRGERPIRTLLRSARSIVRATSARTKNPSLRTGSRKCASLTVFRLDEQLGGDLAVGLAVDDDARYPELALAQVGQRSVSPCPCWRVGDARAGRACAARAPPRPGDERGAGHPRQRPRARRARRRRARGSPPRRARPGEHAGEGAASMFFHVRRPRRRLRRAPLPPPRRFAVERDEGGRCEAEAAVMRSSTFSGDLLRRVRRRPRLPRGC